MRLAILSASATGAHPTSYFPQGPDMYDTDERHLPLNRIAALQSARAQILAASHGLPHPDLRVAADALERVIDAIQREEARSERRETLENIEQEMSQSVAASIEHQEGMAPPVLSVPRIRRR